MFPDQEPCVARGNRRGFKPGAAARHSQQARVQSNFFFSRLSREWHWESGSTCFFPKKNKKNRMDSGFLRVAQAPPVAARSTRLLIREDSE